MPLPPGPRLPGLLQLLGFMAWPLPFFAQCVRRYGDPFFLRLPGFGDVAVVTAPALIKQVFTADPEQLYAGKANGPLAPLVGERSVMLLDGKSHLRQRRLLLPPFHGERMQAYATLMAELASARIDCMPLGRRFALMPHMQTLTLQIILRAVFGLEEGSQMDHLARLIIEFMTVPQLMVFCPPKYQRFMDVPLSPYRTFLLRRAEVDRRLREIIRARKAAADPERTDILSLLLSARDEDGQPMSEDELRDELVTMLFAGHETTATALSWALYYILREPAVEARLRAEIAAAQSSPAGLFAFTASEYLDAVIKEALRLQPIVPFVARRIEQPLRLGDYDMPVGSFVVPCIHLAHRRPETWPDPDRFLPERFIGVKPDPYAFFPFSGGTRRCLGMAFALYEMKIVLGVLLSRTELQLGTDKPIRSVHHGLTRAPAGGTPIIVRARHESGFKIARSQREPLGAASGAREDLRSTQTA